MVLMQQLNLTDLSKDDIINISSQGTLAISKWTKN